ncbi:MAG TPA: DUF3048 domain-containing protein [Chloroflexota bacterium]|nr:DUF3048 domain-containing protein [Chloroflexota bacterium]
MPIVAALTLAACGSQASKARPPEPPTPPAEATVAPAPTLAPVPTETPDPVLRSPLTGLPVDGPDEITRRPLVVKIGNSEAERPQAGLAQADVVYESVTEGGITRYAAVFQSQEASNVGPVRSARLSDLQIAPEFNAVLAHVGASSPIMTMLHNGTVSDLDQFFFQQYYHRTADRVPPYNVYTSTDKLRAGAQAQGFGVSTAKLAPYAFESGTPPRGNAGEVDFDFAKQTHAAYVYDAGQHAYHQVEYGQPTADAGTGKPVQIANLVLQFTPVQTTDIVEDRNGTHSLEYDLVGSGKAMVFHDGQELDGTWERDATSDRTAFLDASGKPIPFARGSVWIAIVDPGTDVLVMPIGA